MKAFGVLLILFGVAMLAYGGISYTTHKRAFDMGPVHVERTKHHHLPVPPMLGLAGVLVGGILLLTGGSKAH